MSHDFQTSVFSRFVRSSFVVTAIAVGLAGCESLHLAANIDSAGQATEAAEAAQPGDVLVIGGSSVVSITASSLKFKGESKAELFNPTTKTFAPTDALTSARGGIQAIGFASGARAHQVLVPGGASGTGSLNKTNGQMTVNANALKTSELYKNSLFGPGAAMGGNRAFYTATVLKDGTVLVTGGFKGQTPLRTAEIYNPTTNKFKPAKGLMTAARAMHTATLLGNGRVLIVGGITNSQGDTSKTAEVYNPITGRFTKVPDQLVQGVAGHTATLVTGCCSSMNGKVVIAGGFSGNGNASDGAMEMPVTRITIYDAPSNQLLSISNLHLNEARAFHTATMFGGKIHFTGGVFGQTQFGSGDFLQFAGGGLRQSAEVYDPELGSLDCVGGTVGSACKVVMKAERAAHTATLFKTGPLKNKILLIGGNPDRSTEIYDPVAKTFVAAGKLRTGRGFHAAVIVP